MIRNIFPTSSLQHLSIHPLWAETRALSPRCHVFADRGVTRVEPEVHLPWALQPMGVIGSHKTLLATSENPEVTVLHWLSFSPKEVLEAKCSHFFSFKGEPLLEKAWEAQSHFLGPSGANPPFLCSGTPLPAFKTPSHHPPQAPTQLCANLTSVCGQGLESSTGGLAQAVPPVLLVPE